MTDFTEIFAHRTSMEFTHQRQDAPVRVPVLALFSSRSVACHHLLIQNVSLFLYLTKAVIEGPDGRVVHLQHRLQSSVCRFSMAVGTMCHHLEQLVLSLTALVWQQRAQNRKYVASAFS